MKIFQANNDSGDLPFTALTQDTRRALTWYNYQVATGGAANLAPGWSLSIERYSSTTWKESFEY
jgi:hypothetical protein